LQFAGLPLYAIEQVDAFTQGRGAWNIVVTAMIIALFLGAIRAGLPSLIVRALGERLVARPMAWAIFDAGDQYGNLKAIWKQRGKLPSRYRLGCLRRRNELAEAALRRLSARDCGSWLHRRPIRGCANSGARFASRALQRS
jgi:hypothetical protein